MVYVFRDLKHDSWEPRSLAFLYINCDDRRDKLPETANKEKRCFLSKRCTADRETEKKISYTTSLLRLTRERDRQTEIKRGR